MATAEAILADLQIVGSVISLLQSLGQDIQPALGAFYQLVFLKQPLTDAQRASLQSGHQALSAALQAPLV